MKNSKDLAECKGFERVVEKYLKARVRIKSKTKSPHAKPAYGAPGVLVLLLVDKLRKR